MFIKFIYALENFYWSIISMFLKKNKDVEIFYQIGLNPLLEE